MTTDDALERVFARADELHAEPNQYDALSHLARRVWLRSQETAIGQPSVEVLLAFAEEVARMQEGHGQ